MWIRRTGAAVGPPHPRGQALCLSEHLLGPRPKYNFRKWDGEEKRWGQGGRKKDLSQEGELGITY